MRKVSKLPIKSDCGASVLSRPLHPNKECNYLEEENVKTAVRKVNILIIVLLTAVSVYAQQHKTMISGKVVSKEKEIIDLATVYLKGTNYGCMTMSREYIICMPPQGSIHWSFLLSVMKR